MAKQAEESSVTSHLAVTGTRDLGDAGLDALVSALNPIVPTQRSGSWLFFESTAPPSIIEIAGGLAAWSALKAFAEAFGKQFGHRMGDSAADLTKAAGKKFLQFVTALVAVRRQHPNTRTHLLVRYDKDRRPLILPAVTADQWTSAKRLAVAVVSLERVAAALKEAFVEDTTAIDWVRMDVLDNGKVTLEWMGRDMQVHKIEVQVDPV